MGTMSNDTARKLYERLARLERVAEAAGDVVDVASIWLYDVEAFVELDAALTKLKELDHEES